MQCTDAQLNNAAIDTTKTDKLF